MQENEDLIQQINFIGRLNINVNEGVVANVFIVIEKKENTIIEFHKILLMYCINNGKLKDNQFIKQKR